ncbi:hypothetical protein BsIDN1_14710 [Bacillus safensis]|uniref:DJ-1/PfpI domain-containing protein n=1 Tax=Bacillus safensis TaxID=561879 RepID=A0A5S9M3Y6_BACIA|nr:hypothetical protein BsIDN1_14710 [Bacillus safensis]
MKMKKKKTVKGKQGEAEVRVDASIDNVKPEDFDALLIPGGFSPDILRADDRYVQFTRAFMDEKNQYLRFVTDRNCSLQRRRWKAEARLAIHPFK